MAIPLTQGADVARRTQNALTARRQDVFNDETARQQPGIEAAQAQTRALRDGLTALTSPGGANNLARAQGTTAAPAGARLSPAAQGRLGAQADVSTRQTTMANALMDLERRIGQRSADNGQVMARVGRGQQLQGAELNEAGYEAQKGMNIAQLIRQMAFGERQAAVGAAISQAQREQQKQREAQAAAADAAMKADAKARADAEAAARAADRQAVIEAWQKATAGTQWAPPQGGK